MTLEENKDPKGEENESLSVKTISKYLKIEKGLFTFRGILPTFLGAPIHLFNW